MSEFIPYPTDENVWNVPLPTTYEELSSFLNENSTLPFSSAEASGIRTGIINFVGSVLEISAQETVYDLFMSNSDDAVLNHYGRFVSGYFRTNSLPDAGSFSSLQAKIFIYGILELIVLSFQCRHHTYWFHNPTPPFLFSLKEIHRTARKISSHLWRVSDEQIEAAKMRVYEMQKAKGLEHRSLNENADKDPLLAPAEKAKIFYRALIYRNAVGRVSFKKCFHPDEYLTKYEVTKPLIFQQSIKKNAERFFTEYRNVPVSKILAILDMCIECRESLDRVDEGEFDPDWLIRKTNVVAFFLSSLKTVAERLGVPILGITQ